MWLTRQVLLFLCCVGTQIPQHIRGRCSKKCDENTTTDTKRHRSKEAGSITPSLPRLYLADIFPVSIFPDPLDELSLLALRDFRRASVNELL